MAITEIYVAQHSWASPSHSHLWKYDLFWSNWRKTRREEAMWASVIQFCWSFLSKYVPPTLILQEITIPIHFKGRQPVYLSKPMHGHSLTEGKQTTPSVGSVFLTYNSKCDWNTLNFKTNHKAYSKQTWSGFWHKCFLWYVLPSTALSRLVHWACLHLVLTGIPVPFWLD